MADSDQETAARVGCAVLWGLVTMNWSTMPLEYFVVGCMFAAAMIVPAIWKTARASPWQTWAPEVSAIFALLGVIVWIEQKTGATKALGWVFIIVFAVLVIALAARVWLRTPTDANSLRTGTLPSKHIGIDRISVIDIAKWLSKESGWVFDVNSLDGLALGNSLTKAAADELITVEGWKERRHWLPFDKTSAVFNEVPREVWLDKAEISIPLPDVLGADNFDVELQDWSEGNMAVTFRNLHVKDRTAIESWLKANGQTERNSCEAVWLKETVPQPLDFSKSDGFEVFCLRDAAWLWAGYEPEEKGTPDSAREAFRKLESGLKSRDLKPHRDSVREVITWRSDVKRHDRDEGADPNWQVTRAALKSFANTIGEQPPFLFPKARI